MWNLNNGQHKSSAYIYSARRKQQLVKIGRYRLLILIIVKSANRQMKESFHRIFNSINFPLKKLERMNHLMQLNMLSLTKISYQKLKQNVISSRASENAVKSFYHFLQRILKFRLKDSINLIERYCRKKNTNLILSIEQKRKKTFERIVCSVYLNKKRQYFKVLINLSKTQQKKLNKIKVLGIISNRCIKSILQACFIKLIRQSKIKYVEKNPPRPINHAQKLNKQLQMQIEDMGVKLQNKNDKISHLQQQVMQLKNQNQSNNYNSFSQYNSHNRNKSQQLRKLNHNDSYQSIVDYGFPSFLGNSFTTLKSRSRSKKGSITSVDCSCGYKQKYTTYKHNNQSLKNQLEIVKEELEVAKDLNDHFTNQIRQYFGDQKAEIQLDRLNKQLRETQRERDDLRMKVTKYQSHITTLKSQFKVKIQQLYRKVKKQR